VSAFVAGGCEKTPFWATAHLYDSEIVVTEVGEGRFTVTGTVVNGGEEKARNIVLHVTFVISDEQSWTDSRSLPDLGGLESMEVAYVIENGPLNYERVEWEFDWEYW
jgi:hypothetical protein